jgi:SET and MYND domain-containing protein
MAAADALLAALFAPFPRVRLVADAGDGLSSGADGPGDGRGRRVVAATAAEPGNELLSGAAYLSATLPSWRKRVCAFCWELAPRRLTVSCADCSAAFYCSPVCRAAHDAGATPPSLASPPAGVSVAAPLPHAALCSVLKAFSSFKGDAELESVLIMLAESLARQRLEEEGKEAAAGPKPRPLVHAHFSALESHAGAMSDRDRRDFHKGASFLAAALTRAGWPRVPPVAALVDAASAVCSNNFGCWRQPGRAAPAVAAVEEGEGADARADASPRDLDAAPGGALVGRELYISISMFNHSCSPNVRVTHAAGAAAVVADAPISPGDELCVAYVDVDAPRCARRAELRRSFFFECACPRCGAEEKEGSGKMRYAASVQGGGGGAPKRRGRKARVSRG